MFSPTISLPDDREREPAELEELDELDDDVSGAEDEWPLEAEWEPSPSGSLGVFRGVPLS